MALIKCKDCGHVVSDKASQCPNCGCPIGQVEAVQEGKFVEEPKKSKAWILALVIALICLIGGGSYYGYTHFANGKENEVSSIDSIRDNGKDAIVELTPEFIKAIEKYDRLGVFNDGYAAVCKNNKWGYINTKGEEVIPATIDADCAGRFAEGYAFLMLTPESFSIIDTSGKVIFSSKLRMGFDTMQQESGDMPYFIEGKLYVPFSEDTGEVKFAVYDKEGYKTHNVSQAVAIDYYKQHELGDYTTYNTEIEDANGYPDIQRGVKDAKGNVIVKPQYDYVFTHSPFDTDWLDNDYKHKISNGVVLVALLEENDESPLSREGVVTHYAYVDHNGKDTFNEADKKKCAESKIVTDDGNDVLHESDWEEIQAQRLHDRAKEYEQESQVAEDYSWLNGNWRYRMQSYGQTLEMRVGISGDVISVFLNGEHFYTGKFTIEDDNLVYNRHNGMYDYLVIDKNNHRLKADNTNYMERF